MSHLDKPYIGIQPERDNDNNLTGRYTLTVLGTKDFILDALDHGNPARMIESLEHEA